MNDELKKLGTELLTQLSNIGLMEYDDSLETSGLLEQVVLQDNIVQSAYFFDMFQNLHTLPQFRVNDDLGQSGESTKDSSEPTEENEIESGEDFSESVEIVNKKEGNQERLKNSKSENGKQKPLSIEPTIPTVQTEQVATTDLKWGNQSGDKPHNKLGDTESKPFEKNEASSNKTETSDSLTWRNTRKPNIPETKSFAEMAGKLAANFEEDSLQNLKNESFEVEERRQEDGKREDNIVSKNDRYSLSRKVTCRVATFDNLINDLSQSKHSLLVDPDKIALEKREENCIQIYYDQEKPSLQNKENSERLSDRSSVVDHTRDNYISNAEHSGKSFLTRKDETKDSNRQQRFKELLQQVIKKTGREEVYELVQAIQSFTKTEEEIRQRIKEETAVDLLSSNRTNIKKDNLITGEDVLMKRFDRPGNQTDEQYRSLIDKSNVDVIIEGIFSEPTVPLLSTTVRYAKRDCTRHLQLKDLRLNYRRFYGE